ncbi:TMV resistance protein N-like protein, partial [Tanacetum coccineum]
EIKTPVPFILNHQNSLPISKASDSSSHIIGSPGLKATSYSYDIFLSFRGEDTRNSFTDHLYASLMRAGIHTFRDDYVFRGQILMPEIRGAIQKSRGSIIILSKNYTTSSWCLDELLLILEQRKERNHFVLPVFYGVDPLEVGRQSNTFNIEVINTSTRWTPDNVSRWKEALKKVASFSGLVLSG